MYADTMTVEQLIEELQRMPDKKEPVLAAHIRIGRVNRTQRDGRTVVSLELDETYFDDDIKKLEKELNDAGEEIATKQKRIAELEEIIEGNKSLVVK